MGSVWIIADTHLKCQPRKRVKEAGLSGSELDELIVENWRRAVSPDDIVWHLGDVGCLQTVKCLPGLKRLVTGNGDKSGMCLASGAFISVKKRDVFEDIELVHQPTDARAGGVVFHGHLHGESDSRPAFLCLSVDQTGFAPISWTDALFRSSERLALSRRQVPLNHPLSI
ncbi:MAG: hypothetical protein ABIT04_04805 [Novosphingobium sp.]